MATEKKQKKGAATGRVIIEEIEIPQKSLTKTAAEALSEPPRLPAIEF